MAKPLPNVVNAASPRRAGAGRAPLLDRFHLARQTVGDAALAADLLALFRDQTRDALARLAETDPDGMRDLAHRLKGAARAVGAARVALAAEALEEAVFAADGDDAVRAHLLADLSAAAARTLAAIAAVLRRGDVLPPVRSRAGT